nr:hypothetical protein Itr_chr03CG22660 [Ipomoea trifida]
MLTTATPITAATTNRIVRIIPTYAAASIPTPIFLTKPPPISDVSFAAASIPGSTVLSRSEPKRRREKSGDESADKQAETVSACRATSFENHSDKFLASFAPASSSSLSVPAPAIGAGRRGFETGLRVSGIAIGLTVPEFLCFASCTDNTHL